MQRILSKAAKLGILEQADWATPGTPTSTYEEVYVDSSSLNFNQDINISGFDLTSGVGLFPERARQYTDATSGLPKVKFTMPPTRRNLALFFAGALHKATEVTTTPYQKVITPLAETVVPDFYTNAGTGTIAKNPHIFTLALSQGGVGHGLLKNAIVNNLTLKFDFNARGVPRLGSLDVEFVGTSWEIVNSFSGATFTATAQAFYNEATQCVVQEFGAVLNLGGVKTFELNINNNTDSDVKTAGGVALDYKINPTITATATFANLAGTYEVANAFKDGSQIEFELIHGTTGNAGYLKIYVLGRMTNNDFLGHSEGYEDITVTIQAEKASSGTDSLCTVTIADAIDRNWIAP